MYRKKASEGGDERGGVHLAAYRMALCGKRVQCGRRLGRVRVLQDRMTRQRQDQALESGPGGTV